jgi:hypothetical protein
MSPSELRRADHPSVSARAVVAADISQVWAVISDISLPIEGSGELHAVEWVAPADGPEVGAVFLGHNRNDHMGEWTTTCTLVACDAPRSLRWAVNDPPLAWWGYELSSDASGTTVVQTFQLGPGTSGLDPLIEKYPEREHEFITGRFEQKRAEMAANLMMVGARLGVGVTPLDQ